MSVSRLFQVSFFQQNHISLISEKSCWSWITDTKLENLKPALKKIRFFKSLSLYFKYSHLIWESEWFCSCVKITDIGLNTLRQVLGKLTSLQSLSLSLSSWFFFSRHLISYFFNRCGEITDDGLHVLKQGLQSSLQYLSLDFYWFENFYKIIRLIIWIAVEILLTLDYIP